MNNLIIIGIIVALIIIVLILIKFREIRQRAGIFLIIAIIVFVIITMGQVIKINNVDIKTFEGITSAGKLYFTWLVSLGKNIFNKIQLNSDYAIGHIIPEYILPLTKEIILEAISKTKEKPEIILLDWKGLGNSEQKQEIINLLNSQGLGYRYESKARGNN